MLLLNRLAINSYSFHYYILIYSIIIHYSTFLYRKNVNAVKSNSFLNRNDFHSNYRKAHVGYFVNILLIHVIYLYIFFYRGLNWMSSFYWYHFLGHLNSYYIYIYTQECLKNDDDYYFFTMPTQKVRIQTN